MKTLLTSFFTKIKNFIFNNDPADTNASRELRAEDEAPINMGAIPPSAQPPVSSLPETNYITAVLRPVESPNTPKPVKKRRWNRKKSHKHKPLPKKPKQ